MIDKKAYTKLVTLYSDKIYRYLSKHMIDKTQAEDLTQDCFLKLWKNSIFIEESKAGSWLLTIAQQSAQNSNKKYLHN